MMRSCFCIRISMAIVCVGVSALTLSCATAGARGPGDIPEGGFRAPEESDRRFTAENGAKPLNNLVFELLNVKAPGFTAHVFRNPREGWVYVRVPKSNLAADKLPAILIDDKEVSLKAVGDARETMRYLSEGSHTIAVAPGAGRVDRLEARAIGELVFAAYGDNPHTPELGNYTWEYLRTNVLDHYNSIIGGNEKATDGKMAQEAELVEWTNEGKRWFTLHPVPDHVRTNDPTQSAEHAYKYWTNTPGMQHPLMSGIWADEFGPGRYQTQYYPFWTEAIRQISADPKYAGRKFYAYGPNRLWPLEDEYETMYPFINALLDGGHGFGAEWYQVEGKSRPGRIIEKNEDLRAEFGPEWEMATRESFERAAKGASTNRVIVMSLLAEPGQENSDLYANYNYNVFLDRQMHFVATDPSFFGVRGLQSYLSSYCPEEQLRLFARLLRHYAIEGNTKPFLDDPYVLTHIQNGDFLEDTKDWTLAPASEESMAVKTVEGLGTLEAKYHAPPGTGDIALWMKRSADKPNVISQEVKGLVPGRLYSLHFITGDYQEFLNGTSAEQKHAVSVTIDNTESIADKCFQAIITTAYWYPYGAFNRDNPYYMNYHQQVFRAKGKTAKLVLSDWTSDGSAGGPDGQELLLNFVQLQPYFESEQ